jgi:glycosyltransferase involved in cell wall biosynthesis
MTSNRLYYRLKPYIPWSVRIRLRRLLAQRQRRLHSQTWPINEAAGEIPDRWPGWPDGKKFALILTHDVEGHEGLDKCRQLMNAERELGFRSSFNFIPEGEYRVSPELRAELVQNGFEVGVHDLRHDGKLYWRREEFSENARSINHYVKEWGASGFRSGFMLHDRECLNDLDIQYDASTFDTDPFEPQPQGVHTIFPFWVSRSDGGGYVELPYTLPQDSTMFLVLKETSSDIWKKKLDWIVKRGGMALVNVHPDYVSFGDRKRKASEFPVAWYQDFLKYVRENYAGKYWQALPKEIAKWYRETHSDTTRWASSETFSQRLYPPVTSPEKKSLAGKSAAVVLYSYYATDPRPRREAETLQRAGMAVDVFCLRPNLQTPWHQKINGVNVFHLPLRRRRAGKVVYMAQYGWFLTCAFFSLSAFNLEKRYDIVHVHNMPDFLVFSALLPRLRGAKVILDLHDPMPELFRSIYGLPEEHYVVRWLKKMEKRSIAFAHLVLTPNRAFKELFISRSCGPRKIQTVMNSPDTTIFNPDRHPPSVSGTDPARPFILMYHGLLVERHGLDLAIRAVKQLRSEIPGIQLHMYGEPTDYLKKIHELVAELGLKGVVQAHGFKHLDEIAKDISKIDLGLIPNRSSSFTRINFPTRIFEYLAMHKPVIVPNTKGIQDYFAEDEIIFFKAGDHEDLAAKIKWAFQNPAGLEQRLKKARVIYEEHNWNAEEKRFIGLVTDLVAQK